MNDEELDEVRSERDRGVLSKSDDDVPIKTPVRGMMNIGLLRGIAMASIFEEVSEKDEAGSNKAMDFDCESTHCDLSLTSTLVSTTKAEGGTNVDSATCLASQSMEIVFILLKENQQNAITPIPSDFSDNISKNYGSGSN